MPRFSPLPLALALCAAFSAQAEETPGTTTVQAEHIEGVGKGELQARGNVQIDSDGRRIEADWVKLFQDSGELQAGATQAHRPVQAAGQRGRIARTGAAGQHQHAGPIP